MNVIARTGIYAQCVQTLCNPNAVDSVILCSVKDHILDSMLKANGGCKVVVRPQVICG